MRFDRLVLCLLVAGAPLGIAPAEAQVRGKTTALLAVSWQPAFCETRPDKPECRSQTADRFDASHFTLHGLWPMRSNYCGVSQADIEADKAGKWTSLPSVELTPETKAALDRVMPGTQSALERHEWIKHGTCTGQSQQDYFADALALMDELNASPVANLFARNVGQVVTAAAVQNAFDESFGKDASRRVKMRCERDGDRRIITELTIGLGATAAKAPLATRIQAAGGTKFDCDEGVVDGVGLQ
ncbi:ribonuclease T2 family protein [Allorhizobium undicola]|uniref:ribonuclease T2 family protein n=1 Tax=Allorhizobium undicola TaxID=78527 RepID=UPI003D32DC8C